jgi:hypothetical protein
MVFRGRDWRDMSEHLVHFTKPRAGDSEDDRGYSPMMSILYDRVLRTGEAPFGAARRITALGGSQRVVCFSEIPLGQLARLVERRSRYGIGFRKDILVAKGTSPLWYLDNESPHASVVREIIRAKVAEGVDPADPFWQLTPLIDHPGVYNGRSYRFEWEREWRAIGEVRFTPDEVAFLFIPEELHLAARQFSADVKVENSGPHYECPFIDAAWPGERIEQALSSVPQLPEPSAQAAPWWL